MELPEINEKVSHIENAIAQWREGAVLTYEMAQAIVNAGCEILEGVRAIETVPDEDTSDYHIGFTKQADDRMNRK